jgi:hypothetical protein
MENLSTKGKEEILSIISEAINDKNNIGKSESDIHNEYFNSDYFIIGRYEAKKWLEENYGIFEAIEKVKTYEEENFGELNTEIYEPERLVNMLVYILSEELINNVFSSVHTIENEDDIQYINENIENE